MDNGKTVSSPTNTGDAEIILNLENLIKNHVSNIDRLKETLKKNKEMLDDIFLNDQTYKLHCDKVKEAGKVRANTKAQIMKQPNVFDLAKKIKEMQAERKELEGALSDYLREYTRLSGTNEIEGEDGEVREIVYTAKLVKKSSRKK
jgi:hypothetical protein